MSRASDDEYAKYNLSEFTEDDFRQIDADVARNIEAQPQIVIELESPPALDMSESQSLTEETTTPSSKTLVQARSESYPNSSPFNQFRRNGWLSVTDISSLAWCEVQVDYGLRQGRSRPIANRPPSFISAKGKEIKVSKTVAASNDRRTKRGKEVHKRLEQEIKTEEIQVDVRSKEEQWALRLVNMMDSFQCIFREGYTREMPVFGVLEDVVVLGVIVRDEIRRGSYPHSQMQSPASAPAVERKKARRIPSPSGSRVTDFFASSPKKRESESSGPSLVEEIRAVLEYNVLRLIDTKTRKSAGLPSSKDTLPSKIQLMLYYRMFRDLISPSPLFDFTSVWNRQGVDASAPLSHNFLVQTALSREGDEQTKCLNDLVETWKNLVQVYAGCTVDQNLQIIYRKRGEKVRVRKDATKGGKGKGKGSASSSIMLPVTQEELDVSTAIELSLRDVLRQDKESVSYDSKSEVAEGIELNLFEPKASTEKACMGETHSKREHLDLNGNEIDVTTSSSSDEQSSTSYESSVDDSSIIGTTVFEYEEEMLNRHLAHALQWWHGRREPRGVSIENSHRCHSCEYISHCEWREQKAAEFQKLMSEKKKSI